MMTGSVMAALRGSMPFLSNKTFSKSLVYVTCLLLPFAVLLVQQVGALAADSPDMYSPAGQTMTKMKERLNLTEEQETKIRPIIEQSMKERSEILKNSQEDRNTIKKELQDLQWSTDVQLGMILTEKQMKEYQKFREEEIEKTPGGEMQPGRGSRGVGSRGF